MKTTQKKNTGLKLFRSLLAGADIRPHSLPAWLESFAPDGEVIRGNNAAVINVETPGCFPTEIIIKLIPEWDGQLWYHPALFDENGRRTDEPAGQVYDGDNTWYVLLEEKIDYDAQEPGFHELIHKLRCQGLEASDPGSGPSIGYSHHTRRWVVSDRDAVASIGSGVHDVEQAYSLTDEEYACQQESAEEYNLFPSHGFGIVSMSELTDDELAGARALFGERPVPGIEWLLDLLTDPGTDRESALGSIEALAGNDKARAAEQLELVICIARRIGIRLNRWTKNRCAYTQQPAVS